MNPPSALHSAMGRERKPFSYLPGGLDLSQIKSERMAQRLMRNAMNQGVPEVPAHQIQSPPTPSTPVAVPNFSCLPVQVIPTGFTLPANPKSLLRSRSNPDRNRVPPQRRETPQTSNPPVPQTRIDQLQNSITKTAPQVSQINNACNNRPASMFEYGYSPNNNTLPKTNYGSDENTIITLPEISYEAEYLTTEPMYYEKPENKRHSVPAYATNQASTTLPEQPNNANVSYTETTAASPQQLNANMDSTFKFDKNANLMSIEPKIIVADTDCTDLQKNPDNTETSSSILAAESISIEPIRFENKDVKVPIFNDNFISSEQKTGDIFTDKEVNETCSVNLPEVDVNVTSYGAIESKPAEDITESSDEQKQVKVVKKVVKKEKKVEESESNVDKQNGDHNGDAEAELVLKLPAKKSGSKTETKVEVLKKTLPDGSVEEVTKTTTKTTASDGSVSIKTKTETKTIPKQEFSEEEVEEEEEEQQETGKQIIGEPGVLVVQENAQKVTVKKEESTTATTTKKKVTVETNEPESEEEVEEVIVPVKEAKVVENKVSEPEVKKVQEVEKVEEEEDEEEEEEDEEEVVVKKPVVEPVAKEASVTKKDEEEEESEEEEEVVVVQKAAPVESKQEEALKKNEEEEVEEEEEYEEAEEVKVESKKPEPKAEVKPEPVEENKAKEDDEESEYTDEEIESEPEEKPKPAPVEKSEVPAASEKPEPEVEKPAPKAEKPEEPVSVTEKLEQKVPLREPSIPLEKVEDVEIKPIGTTETVTKSYTKNTEIITSPAAPAGSLSTQTEYNKVENIVTVNRTTKTLDNTYEQITQSGIPTMKTYFAPNRERVSTSPQPSKPYTPAYNPEPPRTERRHSLLLDRLSTERQMPGSEVYQNNYNNQYNNQTYEQRWSQEPQSEIVNVSNVKPSTITNSQWYQQSRNENVLYNNLTPSTAPPASQLWSQPQHPQQQPPQSQQPQPQQAQYQPSYTQSTQDYSKVSSNTYQQNSYPSYTPKPSSWGNNNLSNVDTIPSINVQPNQYSNRSQQTSYPNAQHYTSSYVPPPWEQDPNYVAPATSSFFQPRTDAPQPSPNTFSPNAHPGWKPPQTKFSKPPPTAYVPPAPNQSFVKSVNAAEPPRQPGRKTYYSEYERRYITVPESTYVPGESKFQAQPDPSPQYYYDNNEQPTEQSEPQWRKELREFTEKTSQTQYNTQQSVNPPWESEPNYAKSTNAKYTPTPSWSQTLRPQSWRERSFESEIVSESQEWTKSNTIGRTRPVSSYVKPSEAPVLERPRGVSVDRYNPNSYSGPIQAEHPPVQAQTLTAATAPQSKGYHNPNVPAYHARASAEPREQPAYQQPRGYVDHRASPIQSRSFKYLQWITGTEQ